MEPMKQMFSFKFHFSTYLMCHFTKCRNCFHYGSVVTDEASKANYGVFSPEEKQGCPTVAPLCIS